MAFERALVALVVALAGCGSGSSSSRPSDAGYGIDGGSGSSGGSSSGGGGSGADSSPSDLDASSTGPDGPSSSDAGACATDPLRTGLTAVQTGISVDAFDCPILKWATFYGEPDPMVFKAIIYVESRFDDTSVACPNLPCGTPTGWTAAESGCYGLMQVVPACHDQPNDAGLLATGHPNLTTDMTSAGWATSIFNPDVNIETGISGVAGNRKQEEAKFSGCTADQYTMMAIGDYNSYGSTQSCTVYNTAYDNGVIAAYKQYAQAAGYAAHPY